MTVRGVAHKKIEGVAPYAGPRPDLAWTPIGDIVIDETYQRPLGEKNWRAIARIARAFDWGKFTPVVLAPCPDGRMALIDGQHRVHAAAAAGVGVVPSMIVAMDPAAQAEAFAWINSQVTAVTAFHILKAGIAAGTPWAVAARDCVDAAGCRLMTYNVSAASRRPRDIFALALVRSWVEQGKASGVTRALRPLAMGDAGREPVRYNARVLRPWFAAVAARPDLSDGQLEALCARTRFEDLVRMVHAKLQQDAYRGRTFHGVLGVLFEVLLRETYPARAA